MNELIKNRFSPSEKVVSPSGEGRAKQEQKIDCDINTIMKKFQKTGTVSHVSRFQPQYGEASPADYHHSMNVILQAQNMFNELPSSLRNRFHNDPAEFLEFVQDEKNAAEAKELGLALAPDVQERLDKNQSETQGASKSGESKAEAGKDAGQAEKEPQKESESS